MGLLSSLFGGGGSAKRAASVQADAYGRAAAIQKEMYDTTRGDLMPYQEQGKNALAAYSDMVLNGDLSKFQESPGYQNRLNEASAAIENSAAARGSLLSGRTLKELSRFNQDYASNEYINYLAQLDNLMKQGSNAAAQTGSIGSGLASNQGQFIVGQGQASADGMVAKSNQLANAGQNILGFVSRLIGF